MSSLKAIVATHIQESIQVKQTLLDHTDLLANTATKLVAVFRAGGTLYSCGNGGSTCDAMHLTEELVARYLRERPGIRAHHLCDSATLTCWSNDYSFEKSFERQVQTFVSDKDALICFSTSGNSSNILSAIKAANELGALTIGLLGKTGGHAKELVDVPIVIQSNRTARIQEAHSLIIHLLCELIETEMYPQS